MTVARAARDLRSRASPERTAGSSGRVGAPSRRFTGLVLLLVLPCAASAQQTPATEAPAPGPRLEVERTVRFDEIVQGTVLELRVPVKNGGTAPLTIHKVEPSCGCTAVKLPGAPIPPGGQDELVLRYDSTEKLGSQSVQLHVYTDDPTQQDMGRYCTRILLQGDVRSLYRTQPAGCFFGEVVEGAGGGPLERVVTVTGQAEARDGFTARVAPGAPPHLQVELEPLPPTREGGKPRGVKVKLRLLPGAPRGELQHVVVLETDLEKQPRVRIPVVGLVVGRVTVPEAVQFLRVPRGTRVERRVPVERRDGAGPLSILRLESPHPWLEVKAETLTTERSELHVTLTEGAPPGAFAFVLRAVLSEPAGEVAEVPVFGLVLPRVRCEPAVVLVGGEPVERRLTLVGGKATAVRFEPEGADLQARLDGDAIVIAPASGSARASALIITTDVAGEERLTVPVERLP